MESGHPPDLPPPLVLKEVPGDLRLYVPQGKGWEAHIKHDADREYCYFKTEGQDYFHLLLQGEIYLQYGETKYCLNCAYRFAHITDERLFWQKGVRRHKHPPL